MELLKSEQDAVDVVLSMGRDTATAEFEAINDKADKKMRSLCGEDLLDAPPGYTILDYMNQNDLSRRHTLILGLTLSERSPAIVAHEKIIARIALRNANRKRKTNLAQCNA